MGASAVLVPVQVSVDGWYLAPLSVFPVSSEPPHTIISLPVQMAVWPSRAVGALLILMDVQVSVDGLYFPPVFKVPEKLFPPQTIISVPVQTAV
jgi:hypothetical protein